MTICGIDRLDDYKSVLKDAKLGVLTAPTGINKKFQPSYQVLAEDYEVTALFAPEHGIRGDAQAGAHISTYVDDETGLTVYSLYGENKYPNEEMLSNIDVMIFDMQDVGARYYTYLYALSHAMIACARDGKELFVLDRPNPINGLTVEGTILDEQYPSGVGEYAIPVRYGLTIGEFALYINKVKNIGCKLTVVPCDKWKRSMWFDQTGLPWILPSPNIPNPVNASLNYIATCYFEGTNISEGRGTTMPFELVGAPFLNGKALEEELNSHKLDGVHFRRTYFTPTFEKHAGTRCEGVQLHITDRKSYRPFEAGMYLYQAIKKQAGDNMKLLNNGMHLVHLFGDKTILEDDFNVAKCVKLADKTSKKFKKESKEFWLY